jgi:hypothetical protein
LRRPGARRRPAGAPPPLAADVENRWADLAGADAFKAYQVMQELELVPRLSVPLLGRLLRPVPRTAGQDIAQHIRDLDSSRFANRTKALRALESLGELAAPELEKAWNSASLEVRRRSEELLAKASGR